MLSLTGKNITLRALEPEDLEFLYALENDPSIWFISETQKPYSKYILKQYLKNSYQDIYEAKQLRLAICTINFKLIGLIDVFDFNVKNRRAGIGILIKNEEDKGKGYGTEALQILMNYCFKTIRLHQLYANVTEDNKVSLDLFKKAGFKVIGLKKDWLIDQNNFKNEYMLQYIKD